MQFISRQIWIQLWILEVLDFSIFAKCTDRPVRQVEAKDSHIEAEEEKGRLPEAETLDEKAGNERTAKISQKKRRRPHAWGEKNRINFKIGALAAKLLG